MGERGKGKAWWRGSEPLFQVVLWLTCGVLWGKPLHPAGYQCFLSISQDRENDFHIPPPMWGEEFNGKKHRDTFEEKLSGLREAISTLQTFFFL